MLHLLQLFSLFAVRCWFLIAFFHASDIPFIMNFFLGSIIFLPHSMKICINCATLLWHFVDICLLQLCSQAFLFCFTIFSFSYLCCVYRQYCVNSDDNTRDRKNWGFIWNIEHRFLFLHWIDVICSTDTHPSEMLIASLRILFSFDFVCIFCCRLSRYCEA